MSSNASSAGWELFTFLPNLRVPIPSPFDSPWICICSGQDPRLKELIDNPANATGLRMLERFTTTFGNAYKPAVLLVRTGVPDTVLRQSTLRAFRNVCCSSSIGHAVSMTITATGSTWLPHHSDHFLFGIDVPMKDGSIGKLDAIVTGFSDEIDRFHGHPSQQIERPDHFDLTVDKFLFKRLLGIWERHYVRDKRGRKFRQLFRSLDVAFQAGRFASDGFPSINDYGTRIGLWVSAFEVLFHPGGSAKVTESIVHGEIRRVQWNDPALRHRRFSINDHSRRGMPRKPKPRVNLVQAIYHDLYKSRNKFMHGNRVTEVDQLFRRSPRRLSLVALAPVLHIVALRAYLDRQFPYRMTEDDSIEDGLFGFSDVEDALIETIRGQPLRGRGRTRP